MSHSHTDVMIWRFANESNRIEGIGKASFAEIAALRTLRLRCNISVNDLIEYVSIVQPDARLRNQVGLDAQVGSYVAPRGGPGIEDGVNEILIAANCYSAASPSTNLSRADLLRWAYAVHRVYQHLHPFTDGNGRSGRALWLWMVQDAPLGFLHQWYYSSLQESR